MTYGVSPELPGKLDLVFRIFERVVALVEQVAERVDGLGRRSKRILVSRICQLRLRRTVGNLLQLGKLLLRGLRSKILIGIFDSPVIVRAGCRHVEVTLGAAKPTNV